MGTDIHSRIEILQPEGYWQCMIEERFEGFFWDPKQPVSKWNREHSNEPLKNRNYRLFAMLADVRNGRGFAGVDTGDRVDPISEPKGIPFDASIEWLAEVEEWGGDLHSHSYLTLEELEAYDWDGLTFERGYVTEEDYLAVRGTNSPPPGGWSGGVGGYNIVSVSAMEYEALTPEELAQIKVDSTDGSAVQIYVQHQWAETRRDNMGELTEALAVMREFTPKRALPGESKESPRPERIRLVFAFDS
jgi:hypothetical protein